MKYAVRSATLAFTLSLLATPALLAQGAVSASFDKMAQMTLPPPALLPALHPVEPIIQDPYMSLEGDGRAVRYAMRVTWGQLEPGGDRTPVTDWSGALRVDAGFIVVKRLVRFERRDRIVERKAPEIVGVISQTKSAYDGLEIVVGFPDDNADHALNLRLGKNHLTFTQDRMEKLSRLHAVDRLGNMIAVHAQRLERGAVNGFSRGHWEAFFPHGPGAFHGNLAGRDGLRGYIEGIFLPDADNPGGTLVGLVYDARLNVIGWMDGVYRPAREGHTGHMEATMYKPDGTAVSSLYGAYADNPARRGGYYEALVSPPER